MPNLSVYKKGEGKIRAKNEKDDRKLNLSRMKS
jgi:hypothetical protein